MAKRYKWLAIYTLKCIAGILLCYVMAHYVPWIDFTWSLISVLLVLSPEGSDAPALALTRIEANLIGAATGVALLFLGWPAPLNMMAGAAVSLTLCEVLNLNSGAKSTLAAMVIILLHKEGTHLWDAALSRIAAVVAGCLIGLAITYVFHSLFRIKAPVKQVREVLSDTNREA